MAVFNAAKREIDLKIVYYGPAMCGKTTNVQCIHKMLAPQQRGDLMSLATKDDRTLFFDFLPIELGDVRGFKTRFHIYTVPGQVYYGLTRRAVLTGADGVVFVADSQTNKLQDNLESLKDLADNLKFYKKDITSFPFVLQYNKRDLPHIASVEELNATLNSYNVAAFESSALTGMGVVETLTGICKIVLKQMDSGTAKKKTAQVSEIISSTAKDAAVSSLPSAAPSETVPDDTVLKIFSEVPPAPALPKLAEPVQQDQSPLATAPSFEQNSSFRLRSAESPSRSFDEELPLAPPSLDAGTAAQFDRMHEKSFPASDVQLSDMSSDIGLSFDDDEAVVLDEPELQASELSFDDDEAVVLDEPELQVSELSFDDDEAVVLDEAGVQEPELSFDDDEAVALDEAELQASELFFDDQEATLTIEEPELSFEEVGSELTLEPVSAVCAPTERLDASAGFMLEEPSGAEDFSPLPVERPEVESFSIVTCGQPRKISETSISLPIIIRLNKNDAECPLTITISLDDMQPK